MSNNIYGYSDYNGPGESAEISTTELDIDEDDSPLRSGVWMEGDSLAPPCGTSIPTIQKLLNFAEVSTDDVVYDFGCGDGRVCLEALVKHDAKQCVGIEVEQVLVERFQYLISRIKDESKRRKIQIVHADLRGVLKVLLTRAKGLSTEDDCEKDRFQDLPKPTVLVVYLLPEAIQEIESDVIELLRLIPGLRIVCNTWGLQQVEAAKSLRVEEAEACASTTLHLYTNERLS